MRARGPCPSRATKRCSCGSKVAASARRACRSGKGGRGLHTRRSRARPVTRPGAWRSRAAGARVLAFSRRETALALARSFGAETPAELEDECCDVAIEAAGVQQTLDLAARLPRVRGRLVLAGFHQDGPRTVDLQSWNWRGLDIVNAHERDDGVRLEGIRAAAAGVAEGRLDPSPLYTHVLPLERAAEAFELARTRPEGFVKALVGCR